MAHYRRKGIKYDLLAVPAMLLVREKKTGCGYKKKGWQQRLSCDESEGQIQRESEKVCITVVILSAYFFRTKYGCLSVLRQSRAGCRTLACWAAGYYALTGVGLSVASRNRCLLLTCRPLVAHYPPHGRARPLTVDHQENGKHWIRKLSG